MTDIVIAPRFNGPPSSGNGGYSAGSLATLLGGDTVQVTLLAPPPLATPMPYDPATGVCSRDGAPVLAGTSVDLALDTVDPVSYDEAHAARDRYLGLVAHPFPTCFSCGPDRDDGLAIFPGRTSEREVASTWTPDESLLVEGTIPLPITWAAVDCIGGWSSDIDERPMVLGRMTCQVEATPQLGEPHVLVGRWLTTEGRKTHTLATMYDSGGRVVARTAQTWVEIDLAAFRP